MAQRLLERLARWWRRTPPSFSGPILANVLGWQVLRVLYFNLLHSLRLYVVPKGVKKEAEQLRRDGVLAVPNFLPEDVFADIVREYEQEVKKQPLRPLASKYIVPSSGKTRVGISHFHPEEGTRLRTLLEKHLTQNRFVCDVGSSIVRHPLEAYRPPQIFMNKKMGDEYPDLNSDMYYHADVSYPGVKAYLYLVDIDETNGAFRYAKGTHKLTLKRLWWDYRKSIEHARNRARVNNREILGDETGRSWHCMTRDEEVREGIKGVSMIGKSNTLLVFNVMGFHRRGDFSSDRPRAFAYANYRDTLI